MLQLVSLSPEVRQQMLLEFESDQAVGGAYVSPRLTAVGLRDYPMLFREASRSYDDAWLAAELNRGGRLKTHEERRTKNGTTMVKVPYTAAETLAEGDFNRYYIRGVCLVAMLGGPEAEVEVYRAKQVANPRPASQALVGRSVKAGTLLADLVTHKGDLETALGVPAGPNSGLSVRIPAR